MWISKIELINFKSYQHQVFNFPEPQGGKNIVVIGGMNGYGKTSILEAFYLCLYGKDAIPHLARAGLKTEKGYPTFLERALHGHALGTNRNTMSVMVQINTSPNEGFLVSRKWFYKRNGDWDQEEVLLYEVRDGIRDKPLEPSSLLELLDHRFVPAHVAPFFFFDGEEVKKLADHSRVEQIKMGVEGLLGVVLLRNLEKRLQQYQLNKKYQNGAAVDEQKIQELFDSLTKNEEKRDELLSLKSEFENVLDGSKSQRDDLMSRIMALGGGSGDIANASEIVRQQERAGQELKACQEEMEKVLSSKLPFHLMSKETMDEYVGQLHQEIERIRWDARRSNLEPDKQKFIGTFFESDNPVLIPALTDEQATAIHLRLETAWESLFYPPPEGCAKEILHDYLHGEKRQAVLATIESLRVGARDIMELVERRENLQKKLRELQGRYTKIEGIDRDGTLAKINADLVGINATIERQERELGDLNRQLAALDGTINSERAVYQREHDKLIQSSPIKSAINKAQRVCDLIEELMPQLYSLKIKRLGEAMTEVYQRLAHKKQVAKIEIDETGASRMLSREGSEIGFDKSAGENQIFATALLAGLAQVSGLAAPLLVDTPLGRLDSSHRKNILEYWISDKTRQVILLSQDKEIDQEMFERIRPAVAQTYLLSHQQISHGIGKTIAVESQYFGEASV